MRYRNIGCSNRRIPLILDTCHCGWVAGNRNSWADWMNVSYRYISSAFHDPMLFCQVNANHKYIKTWKECCVNNCLNVISILSERIYGGLSIYRKIYKQVSLAREGDVWGIFCKLKNLPHYYLCCYRDDYNSLIHWMALCRASVVHTVKVILSEMSILMCGYLALSI